MMTFQEIGDGTEGGTEYERWKNRCRDQSSLPGCQSVAVLFLS